MKKTGCSTMRGFHFSGNANNGANAGFAYANVNNAPSNTNANIGSQLCLKLNVILRPLKYNTLSKTLPQKRIIAHNTIALRLL
ncbi:MAG: hypothetical protein II401_10850 [Bacteroidales bacterium]|jgi:hypothetical protein|nr:hypothetical protein [Bacteroidales bacterium]